MNGPTPGRHAPIPSGLAMTLSKSRGESCTLLKAHDPEGSHYITQGIQTQV